MEKYKNSIRRMMIEKRRSLSEAFVSEASKSLCKRLSDWELLRNSEGICAFFPIRGEPDIIPLLVSEQKKGKKIFLPKFDSNLNCYKMVETDDFSSRLKRGKFGIPEPLSDIFLNENPNFPIIWLVPGLAFGVDGSRIGYGKGIYDSMLRTSPFPKVGISFLFQIMDKLNNSEHDVKMDYLASESGILQCHIINQK